FPLGGKHDAPGYHVLVQFPFFWRIQDGNETDTAVPPLYFRVRKPGYAADVAFPLVWRFAGKEATTTVVGPAYWRSSHDGKHHDYGMMPLLGWGTGGGKSYGWATLPLPFWHNSDRNKGTSRTVLGTFFYDRTPNGFTTGLMPLFVGWRRGPTT